MVKIKNVGTGTYCGHDVEFGVVITVGPGKSVSVSEPMADHMMELADVHSFEIVKPAKEKKPKPDTGK